MFASTRHRSSAGALPASRRASARSRRRSPASRVTAYSASRTARCLGIGDRRDRAADLAERDAGRLPRRAGEIDERLRPPAGVLDPAGHADGIALMSGRQRRRGDRGEHAAASIRVAHPPGQALGLRDVRRGDGTGERPHRAGIAMGEVRDHPQHGGRTGHVAALGEGRHEGRGRLPCRVKDRVRLPVMHTLSVTGPAGPR